MGGESERAVLQRTREHLVNADTVPTVEAAFVASAGQPLADRLMAALLAGSRAGGDARGKQFATLQVMRDGPDGVPVNDVVFDVADSPDPVAELDRLFRIHKVSLDLNRVGELRRGGKIGRPSRWPKLRCRAFRTAIAASRSSR